MNGDKDEVDRPGGDDRREDSDSNDDYELEYEPEQYLVAGRISVEVLAVVPPPLEFMSELHTQRREISSRQVWCGSLLLANVLCKLHEKNDDIFHSKKILELGSGTGILGMVVSKLGVPKCVILTDGDEKAISLLEQNLSSPNNEIVSSVTKAKLLRWGESKELKEFSSWCHSVYPDGDLFTTNNAVDAKATMAVTTNNVLFDYIVAGDVLYKEELPPLFFETCHQLLGSNGTLWLCHVPRANVDHGCVIENAKKAGFSIEEYDCVDITVEDVPIDDLRRAKVYSIRKGDCS